MEHSPANHLPCNALTAAMAAAMEGHLTYTLPCKTRQFSLWGVGDTSPSLFLSHPWTWLWQRHTRSTGHPPASISNTEWAQEKGTVVLAGTPLWQLLQHSIFLNTILQDSPNMHLICNHWAMDGWSAPESLLGRGSKGFQSLTPWEREEHKGPWLPPWQLSCQGL